MAPSWRLQAFGLEGVWFCRGQANQCQRVWDHVAGEVIGPDRGRPAYEMPTLAQVVRNARNRVWMEEKVRAQMEKPEKPEEPAPYILPEPPAWDESHPHYRSDKPAPWEAWQAALGRLQLEIPQEQFNTFLRPCAGLRWAGDCLLVGAATTFAVSWLELPLHLEMVGEAVSKTTGGPSTVRYLAMPDTLREEHNR